MLEDIADFLPVGGAIAFAGRSCRMVGVLVEIVKVDPGPAVPGLQPGPAPGVPAEGGVPHQVAGGLAHGFPFRRIGLEEPVRPAPVALPDRSGMPGGIPFAGEARPFVGIVSDQDVDVVETPLLVEPELVVRDHVAVHNGPAASGREAAPDQAGGVQRAQLLEGSGAQFFRDPDPVGFRLRKGFHVLSRIGGRPGRAEGSAALGNGPAEEACGERGGA